MSNKFCILFGAECGQAYAVHKPFKDSLWNELVIGMSWVKR